MKKGIPNLWTKLAWLAWSGWFIFNALTLTRFPFIHSDEPWLAGLSQEILKRRSFLVTEPFFDLYPRQVHALKLAFHALQACFARIFGFNPFTFRLISLVAAALSLFVFYRFWQNIVSKTSKIPLLVTFFLATQIQFLLSAHLARQEIILFLIFVIVISLYHGTRPGRIWLIPTLIGLAFCFHPNAFMLATMLGLLYVKDVLLKRLPAKFLAWYLSILALAALILIGFSILLTPDFLANYFRFGQTFAVDAPPGLRWQLFLAFFDKLFNRVSGSYYLPDIRLWLILTAIFVPAAVLCLVFLRHQLEPTQRDGLENNLLLLAGFALSLFLIGRFNQTSVLFLFLPAILLGSHLLLILLPLYKKLTTLIAVLLLFLNLALSTSSLLPFLRAGQKPYLHYLDQIRTHLTTDAVVLGNLSAYYGLSDLQFYDIRNLGYLDTGKTEDLGEQVTAYLKTRGIDTVIWYEEYDYIIREPDWRILYEDTTQRPVPFLPALKEVLDANGTVSYSFVDPVYGSRIVRYMGDYPWTVRIIRLNWQD